jgi:hypothetical protein
VGFSNTSSYNSGSAAVYTEADVFSSRKNLLEKIWCEDYQTTIY